jgi:ubiquinone/menaquinone biosynthesis C-methylase UbiE
MPLAPEIRLLDASVLADDRKLRELTYWLRVLDRPNGWHYDFDHVWILSELEALGLPPRATILDAGAGQGIMQYLLAARGYNVISLDFSPRRAPKRAKRIFKIGGEGDAEIGYEHNYMKLIRYGQERSTRLLDRLTPRKLAKIGEIPGRIRRRAQSYGCYLRERLRGSSPGYGTIRYVRAPFHDVPLESQIADAVISVSALEHGDITLVEQNKRELLRLLKPGAPLLLTTSASVSSEDVFDTKTAGWCFSRESLARFFDCNVTDYDVERTSRSILASPIFMDRLDPYYHLDEQSHFYRKGFKSLPYLPVAVKVFKSI